MKIKGMEIPGGVMRRLELVELSAHFGLHPKNKKLLGISPATYQGKPCWALAAKNPDSNQIIPLGIILTDEQVEDLEPAKPDELDEQSMEA